MRKILGFTLVELLVVMGVLAILVAGLIAAINPLDRIRQANDTKALNDISQVVDALNAAAANSSNGQWTAWANYGAVTGGLVTSGDLSIAPTAPTGTTYASVTTATTAYVYAKPANAAKKFINMNSTACTATNLYFLWNQTIGKICVYCNAAAPDASTPLGSCSASF